MGLHIESHLITGVYALGQWFKVEPDTIDVDSYEFINWHEHVPDGITPSIYNDDCTSYAMGDYIHTSTEDRKPVSKDRVTFASPAQCHGITFKDAETGEWTSFALLEVRAFRCRRRDASLPRIYSS
jgi:hypothetical protein